MFNQFVALNLGIDISNSLDMAGFLRIFSSFFRLTFEKEEIEKYENSREKLDFITLIQFNYVNTYF